MNQRRNKNIVRGLAFLSVVALGACDPGTPQEVPDQVDEVAEAPPVAEVAAAPSQPAADPDRVIETWCYQALEPATGLERGRQVYEQWCIICHGSGPGMAGTDGLMRKYHGNLPALLTERTDLAPEAIRIYVREGVASMPYFRKVEISDEDLELMISWLTQQGSETATPQ